MYFYKGTELAGWLAGIFKKGEENDTAENDKLCTERET